VLAVLVVLTVIDEDVLNVEHVLTIMTIAGVIITACKVFIPEEVRGIKRLIFRRRDIDLALSVRLFVRMSVTNVLGLYLKDYYRSYCPLLFFHTSILCGTYLSDYKRYQHKSL